MFDRLKKLVVIRDDRFEYWKAEEVQRELDAALVFAPYWAWGFGLEYARDEKGFTNYHHTATITWPLVGEIEFRWGHRPEEEE